MSFTLSPQFLSKTFLVAIRMAGDHSFPFRRVRGSWIISYRTLWAGRLKTNNMNIRLGHTGTIKYLKLIQKLHWSFRQRVVNFDFCNLQ
jgi:hypothetical protein